MISSPSFESAEDDIYYIFDEVNVTFQTYNMRKDEVSMADHIFDFKEAAESSDEEESDGERYTIDNGPQMEGTSAAHHDNSLKALRILELFSNRGSHDNKDEFLQEELQLNVFFGVLLDDGEKQLFNSRHKDYRRFRYYDLIRPKLGFARPPELDPALLGTPTISFDSRVKIFEYEKSDILGPMHVSYMRAPPRLVLVQNDEIDLDEIPDLFHFQLGACPFESLEDPYMDSFNELLFTTYAKFRRRVPSDIQDLQHVMQQGTVQAYTATENVLCAFETLSSLGKMATLVSNRLQASATHFFVLLDPANPYINGPGSTFAKGLWESLAISENIQGDIFRLRRGVLAAEEEFSKRFSIIADSLDTANKGSARICNLFSMAADNNESALDRLQAIVDSFSSYTGYINFLTELFPDRLYQFIQSDFVKVTEDIRRIDLLCGLLLEETRKIIAEEESDVEDGVCGLK